MGRDQCGGQGVGVEVKGQCGGQGVSVEVKGSVSRSRG